MKINICLLLLLVSTCFAASALKAAQRNQILMISFDGLRSTKFEEFLRSNPDCAFNQIINDGVKAEYMIPSFPTLTFPVYSKTLI